MALDNFRTIELIWDKANKSIIKTIKTASSDTTGRYLSVKILDGGQEVTLNNAKLQLYWEHPNFNTSGTDDFNTVNNGGLFKMTFSDEMLTNIGKLNAHLVLILSDGKITSDGFAIEVIKGANDGVVVPTNGNGLVKQIDGKIDKGNVTLGDLTQEVKLAMTGGTVAIVGEDAVGTENIKDKSVDVYKTVGVDVIGFNLYRYPNHVVNGFYIDNTGTIVTGSTSAYAKVPIQPLNKYSMWKEDGSYIPGNGLMVFQDGDGASLSTLNMSTKYNGKYLDLNYITFETPANAKYVLFNVKMGTTFDSRQNVIVLEGSEITAEKLSNKEVTKIFGAYLADLKSRNDIVKLKDSVVGVGGNIYNHETHYIPDYYVNTTGVISYALNWGYAKVPIKSYEQISVWMPNGKYDASIGAIGFYQGNTKLSVAYLPTPSGQYNGINYITLTVPEGADTVAITVKNPASPIFDNSTSLIVTEGDSVSDYALEKRLLSVSGYGVETGNKSRLYEDVVWTALGDSLTEKNIRATTVYHDYVADELGFKVNNMGKSGTGYKNTDANNTAFYQRVLDIPLDTQVVTFFGSLNDFGSGADLGTSSDTGTDTIAGAINTTIDNLYSILPTVPLGIISPTPWHTSDLNNENNSATKYARLLAEICRKRGIPFLDLYFSSGLRPWDAEYRTLMYSKDPVGNGTHPDESGHKLIAPQFREFIKTLI